MGVEKRHVARGGKNINFRREGGINIVFGPKYRPLNVRQYAGSGSETPMGPDPDPTLFNIGTLSKYYNYVPICFTGFKKICEETKF